MGESENGKTFMMAVRARVSESEMSDTGISNCKPICLFYNSLHHSHICLLNILI